MDVLTTLSSSMLVVVATSSLGCGVNMKKIKYIIHFGQSYNPDDYYQQIGRAGRGETALSHAIFYNFPQGGKSISRSMRNYASKANYKCERQSLFTSFNENNETVHPKQPGHLCCSFCASKCECGEFHCENLQIPELMDCESAPKTAIRSVTPNDEELVENLLLESHEQQYSFLPLLTPPELVTGFTQAVISREFKAETTILALFDIVKKDNFLSMNCRISKNENCRF